MSTSANDPLFRALQAGGRGFAVYTTEDERAIELAETFGHQLGWSVHTWSAATGIDGGEVMPLTELLRRLVERMDEELWLVLDGGPWLHEPTCRRTLRELAQRTRGPAVWVVGPPGTVPELPRQVPELRVHHLPLPDTEALTRQIAWTAEQLEPPDTPGAHASLQASAAALARTALGLDLRTTERLLTEGLLEHGPDPTALQAWLGQHKPAALDREGLLEPWPPTPADELGGLAALKAWLGRRALALHPDAACAGIPSPRGVLLLGVQGCGKSVAAQVSAAVLDLPLVRLDVGRLFGGTIGESEANLHRVTMLVERVAPVVLWLDEIDKGLAGVEGSKSDAGTTARVVGSLLTWMQQRRRPVFVAATANRVDVLPPELTRRGRLDETFFIDLPGPDEREAILKIHLEVIPRRRLGHAPPMADPWPAFAALARGAEGLSGAELEGALTEARLDAFAESRPVAARDLERAIAATVPLAASRAETIQALRSWASTRARRA